MRGQGATHTRPTSAVSLTDKSSQASGLVPTDMLSVPDHEPTSDYTFNFFSILIFLF